MTLVGNAIERMLEPYELSSLNDRRNAAKEVIQEIVLCGLSRSGFFDKAAFYGGTALRIFYGLERFSEDLDFSLMATDSQFSLSNYFDVLEKEVRSFGLNVEIAVKEKTQESDIQSAFIKGNTREHFLLFYPSFDGTGVLPRGEKIKIKFEIDTNPPEFANFQRLYRLLPVPYEVNVYDEASLFAGKIHAVLCRSWKNRVKGRDLYDFLFYISRGSRVNLRHLNARLAQTNSLPVGEGYTIDTLKEALTARFSVIDYDEAARDVRPFLKDDSSLVLWKAEFFQQMTWGLEAE